MHFNIGMIVRVKAHPDEFSGIRSHYHAIVAKVDRFRIDFFRLSSDNYVMPKNYYSPSMVRSIEEGKKKWEQDKNHFFLWLGQGYIYYIKQLSIEQMLTHPNKEVHQIALGKYVPISRNPYWVRNIKGFRP